MQHDLGFNSIDIISKIHRKLTQLPNVGQMEVWLQRISYPYKPDIKFKEPLCQLVGGKSVPIWNSDWIKSHTLKQALRPDRVIDKEKLKAKTDIIQPDEINLFSYY